LNICQRRIGNTNPVKLGRCFEFLNNWYGFKHGSNSFQGNQHIKVSGKLFNSPNNTEPSTQKELAESYGISQHTMNNYMRMTSMIPELQDLVETGISTLTKKNEDTEASPFPKLPLEIFKQIAYNQFRW